MAVSQSSIPDNIPLNIADQFSHDLRQPLHAIGLFIDSLEQNLSDTDHLSTLAKIKQSTQALGNLVNGMVEISKLDANAVEVCQSEFDLSCTLQSIQDEFKDEALSKSISFDVESSRAVVKADSVLLSRVLRALVGNAVQYTSEGQVNVKTVVRNDKVKIMVSDTGPGVPKRYLDKLFLAEGQASTNADSGSGLGLSIAGRLIKILGYRLELETGEGKGSTFTITVPAGEQKPVVINQTALLEFDWSERKIMVIEDNELILEAMEKMIQSLDCVVYPASNISEAREIIQELDELPDALLVDYDLAEGETAIAAINEVRRVANKEIPALVVTGNADHEKLRTADRSAYRVMSKPVKPETLKRAIGSALSGG